MSFMGESPIFFKTPYWHENPFGMGSFFHIDAINRWVKKKRKVNNNNRDY